MCTKFHRDRLSSFRVKRNKQTFTFFYNISRDSQLTFHYIVPTDSLDWKGRALVLMRPGDLKRSCICIVQSIVNVHEDTCQRVPLHNLGESGYHNKMIRHPTLKTNLSGCKVKRLPPYNNVNNA